MAKLKLSQWDVSLSGVPSYQVEASSEAGAIEAYKEHFGITRTRHQFHVRPVSEPTVTKMPDLLSEPTVTEGAK